MARMTAIARQALAAEKAAREAEGIFEPTTDQKALLRKRAAAEKRERAAKSEREAIERVIEAEMRDGGVRALHSGGVNLALIVLVTKKEVIVNDGQLEADYPEIVAAFHTYQEIVPEYTIERRVENGDRVNYRGF